MVKQEDGETGDKSTSHPLMNQYAAYRAMNKPQLDAVRATLGYVGGALENLWRKGGINDNAWLQVNSQLSYQNLLVSFVSESPPPGGQGSYSGSSGSSGSNNNNIISSSSGNNNNDVSSSDNNTSSSNDNNPSSSSNDNPSSINDNNNPSSSQASNSDVGNVGGAANITIPATQPSSSPEAPASGEGEDTVIPGTQETIPETPRPGRTAPSPSPAPPSSPPVPETPRPGGGGGGGDAPGTPGGGDGVIPATPSGGSAVPGTPLPGPPVFVPDMWRGVRVDSVVPESSPPDADGDVEMEDSVMTTIKEEEEGAEEDAEEEEGADASDVFEEQGEQSQPEWYSHPRS